MHICWDRITNNKTAKCTSATGECTSAAGISTYLLFSRICSQISTNPKSVTLNNKRPICYLLRKYNKLVQKSQQITKMQSADRAAFLHICYLLFLPCKSKNWQNNKITKCRHARAITGGEAFLWSGYTVVFGLGRWDTIMNPALADRVKCFVK